MYFGTALGNFGVRQMLDGFVEYAPPPGGRETADSIISADNKDFSGFVFKIQANMDPKHHDRIAFMRIVSGQYSKGMKMRHVRLNKNINVASALTFKAGERELAATACAGDIVGLHNHGTIQIGDAFTAGKNLKFTGIPNFSPELFRLVRLKDPLKTKQLLKGLKQLSEEGATQLFMPLNSNQLILGAVGVLQFDVVAHRLQHEYKVKAVYENVNIYTSRWVQCADEKKLEEFKTKSYDNLALDGSEHLVYLAPSRVNLTLTVERWPEIDFLSTREH